MQKSNHFLLFVSALTALILAAAAGTYAWTYVFNPCDVEAVRQASAFLTSQRRAFDDLYQFTTTVRPSGLNPPVTRLQQIFMSTQAVAVPVCMQTAKNELLTYMGTVIRAFQAFAAGEEDSRLRDLVNEAYQHYDNFEAELEAVQKCAPYCLP
jgi:hypothetical protein